MAKLLKKHFGLGSKKGPPHPPNKDYVAQKSSSVQELLSHSPTNERSQGLMSSASSHIGSFDVSSVPDSPNKHSSSIVLGSNRLSQSSVASSLCGPSSSLSNIHGGARPRDNKDLQLQTPLSSGYQDPISPTDKTKSTPDDHINLIEEEGVDPQSCADGEEPQLLDEYSDPFDLKKQIQETPELLGAIAPDATQGVAEDDYSVPYEVKKLLKEKRLREHKNSKKMQPGMDNAGGREGLQGNAPYSPSRNPIHAEDVRPREEYDEPWEWSQTHSMILDQMGLGGEANQQTRSTPLMTKRGTENKVTTGLAEVVAEAEASVSSISLLQSSEPKSEEPSTSNQSQEGESSKSPSAKTPEEVGEQGSLQNPKWYKQSHGQNPKPPQASNEVEEEEVVEVEYENMKDDYDKPEAQQEMEEEEYERYTHLRSEDKVIRLRNIPENDKRTGNYEEPWDLTSTQKDLEDRIKARVVAEKKISPSDSSPQGPQESKKEPAVENSENVSSSDDTRAQEGYEKPWDWKPHKKDDRGAEGYEKPWDWKPHQKDDRPQSEYEQPWDNKAQRIEQRLISAKGAKDASIGASGDARKVVKKDDTRPMDEYDEPWDQKKKNQALGLGPAMDPDPVRVSQPAVAQPQSASPKKKFNLDLSQTGWGAAAEHVDPQIPLDLQLWYHGAISRVDAEALLRVHKEGSYLVRMSESNKLDFSLSLKSSRGFMHMKIVHRDSRFILGQFSQPFDTIPHMIHHYSVNKLPIKGAEHMSLLHPVIHELL